MPSPSIRSACASFRTTCSGVCRFLVAIDSEPPCPSNGRQDSHNTWTGRGGPCQFHLSALANKAVTDYRRELAWALRGRRGRKSDPEWAQRNRLLRAVETLTPDELAKVREAMRRADPSGGLEKCWQGKELLRKLLKLAGTNPDRGQIFNALTAFYLHCADSEISQLRRLAWTVHAWQNSIIAGLHTGISNGRTEGYNRIVKHIGRIAFGFRNQDNQKRRVRYACTRKSRASTSHAKPC